MNKLIVLTFSVLLVSCTKRMTNDEVITEVKKCEAAGMRAERMQRMLDYATVRIDCIPEMRNR